MQLNILVHDFAKLAFCSSLLLILSGVMNTNAAGVDVSSRKSTVAVLRPFSKVVKLPFDVRHSAEDLTALAAQLKSIDGETRVVMEHIGATMRVSPRFSAKPGFMSQRSTLCSSRSAATTLSAKSKPIRRMR